MSWLNHPKYKRIRDETLAQFRGKDVHFRKVKSVAFVCGGAGSARRDRLATYLSKYHGDDLLVFFADDVWNVIATQSNVNALRMETQLAELSDVVPIVVESPGTFAELGAFSLSDPLRKKLLPIVDRQYQGHMSFINSGPLAWIDEDSQFSPTIWTDHDKILLAAKEISARLRRLPPRNSSRISDLSQSAKHLVFFLCDVVSVFGPCRSSDIVYYAEQILGPSAEYDLEMLLALAAAMGILRSFKDKDGDTLYFTPLTDGGLAAFQRTRYLDLPRLRSRVISVMLSIPFAAEALERMP